VSFILDPVAAGFQCHRSSPQVTYGRTVWAARRSCSAEARTIRHRVGVAGFEASGPFGSPAAATLADVPCGPGRRIRDPAPAGGRTVPANRACVTRPLARRGGCAQRRRRNRLCRPAPRTANATHRGLGDSAALRRRLPCQCPDGTRQQAAKSAVAFPPSGARVASPAAPGPTDLVGVQLHPPSSTTVRAPHRC
jgi:hypothetical protein